MNKNLFRPATFFDFQNFAYKDLFANCDYVWDVLKELSDYIRLHVTPEIQGKVSDLASVENTVFIGEETVVEAGVVIKGPSIIGARCEIRAGAYIRENSLIGDESVIGHASEVKHSILFNRVSIPHCAYVGDSILGRNVHLGAGVRLSNFKINSRPVSVRIDGDSMDTGLMKLGAILGDGVEIGCNSVLNPGTCIGKNTLACANLSLKGYYGENLFIKLIQEQQVNDRKL
jgi:NDP-sugar pyrophosphorylase family protein